MYFRAMKRKDEKEKESIVKYIRKWNNTHPEHLSLRLSKSAIKRRFKESGTVLFPHKQYIPKFQRNRRSELEDIYLE